MSGLEEVSFLEVRDQLFRLLRLQEIAHGVRAARDLVNDAPARIEEIESRFRERNAEYIAVRQRHDALQEDQTTRSTELTSLEESKKKYMADLMQVQNQREYAAMLREIDAVKSQISEHEEAILKDMEEIEGVKKELATHEEHIQEERRLVDSERADVEAAIEQARESIAKLETERTHIESELPSNLVFSVRRLEENRQGLFLSRAEDGVCQSCFVRVRPQGFQEIRLALKVHYCSNCRRLLYHEPSLKRMAAAIQAEGTSDGTGDTNSDAIQAVDGGSV
jgi:predicted  nucleic acid-binding Zn-ribbon protein